MKTNFKKLGVTCALSCMVLMLSGCKVGPDYRMPEFALPESWIGTKETPKLQNVQAEKSEWWKNFKDPVLDELVEKAKAQNLSLKEAKARVAEARALAHGADAELFPQINVGAGVTKRSKNGATGGNTKLFEAGFDAIWEADIFGGNRRVAESAQAEYEAAEAEYNDVMLSLIAEVARNYVQYRLYQQQLALAKQTLETQNGTARITEARYKEGVEGKLEVVRAGAQLNLTKAQVPLYENLTGASAYRLEFLLGGKPGSLEKQLAETNKIPISDPLKATSTPLAVMSRRPDVKLAERKLASATALQGAAIADMYPKLSLSAVLGLENGSADRLFRSSSKVWSVGGNLLMPLFDFGRIRSRIDASDARQEQAMVQYESVVLAALGDVETAMLAYAKESERTEMLTEAAANSKKAVEISQLQYKEGIISQLDVLQAQQTMYEAENALAESNAAVAYNLIALNKALALF